MSAQGFDGEHGAVGLLDHSLGDAAEQEVAIEVEGGKKPACVAETLTRLVYS